MTFTKSQQTASRKAYIEECRQKAWGAACHADWISQGLDRVMAHYTKLQEEDRKLEEDIKAAELAVDSHTYESRTKRKAMQERRNVLSRQCNELGQSARQGQEAMQNLLATVETSLALAKHAEEWEWKEVDGSTENDSIPRHQMYKLLKDWSDRKAGEVITAEEIGEGVIYKDLIARGIITEG